MSSQANSTNELLASKLFTLKDFVAVVTGGGTGIGLMITQAFIANGAKVYITGRRQGALDTVVKTYSKQGGDHVGEIIGISCDITNVEEIKNFVSEIEKREERGVHVLVNNAGVAKETQTTKVSSQEHPPNWSDAKSVGEYMMKAGMESWRQTFETNVIAQYFISAAFVPLLGKAQKSTLGYSPTIINVTSISGYMKGSSGGQYAYSASKAAFLHLTQMLASSLTEAKIRVNSIAPGIFPSEMTTEGSDEHNKSDIGKKIDCPAGRAGNDSDMAAAALYLAGYGGVYLNGQVLYPDGGMMLTSPARSAY